MPVSSRSQRAEARYNVTTEFPHLGLHSAAATGNIGLVKYALSHGQPINSVIDGVLPLHAACAGGNDLVVKLLIDNGADVNAPRLPRRYSSDKSRTPSAPIVGNSGSTPLHFAAANGHTHVVHTLLRHGARPDRADKHGVTPATLARQSGWIATADTIQDWLANRDQDLRERETMLGNPEPPDQEDDPAGYVRARHASICGCAPGECVHTARSRRLAMKRSIDNVIHRFKSSSSLTAPNALAAYPDSSSSPDDAYTCATPDSVESPVPPRRPSLTPQDDLPSPKSRRPSSAGTGAEPSKEKAPRKLASKYALLHRFKRPSAEALSARSSPSPHPHRTSSSTQPQPQTQEQERVDASKPLVDSPLPLPITPARRRSASHHRSHSALDDTPASSPPSVRPGILRAHGRSSSSGQSQMSSSSHLHAQPPRALRFNHARPSRAEFDEFDEDAEAEADLDPDFDDDFDLEFEEDEDEDEYGQPIPSRLLNGGEGGDGRDRRPRGRSITSTQSLSPLSENPLARAGVDFPFSINRPPEEDVHAHAHTARPSSLPTPSHAHAHMHARAQTRANGTDGRARGDSMSTTGTQSSAGLRTPAPAPAHLASVATGSPAVSTREIDYPVEAAYPLAAPPPAGAWNKDRPRPRAIDIAAISSHAQAEELVQRAQRSVLELAHAPEPAFGAMPLSARLAAYGESLALERRLREGSGARRASEGAESVQEAETPFGMKPRSTSVSGLGNREEVEGMSEVKRRAVERAGSGRGRGRERRKGSGRRAESAAGEGGFLTPPNHAVLASPARNSHGHGHGHLRSRSAAPPGLEYGGDHGLELDLGAVASLETAVPRTLSASASSSAFFASRTPNASTLFAPRTPDTSTLFAPHPTPASASERDASRSLDASAPVVTLTRSRTPDPGGLSSTVPEAGDAMHLSADRDLEDCKEEEEEGGMALCRVVTAPQAPTTAGELLPIPRVGARHVVRTNKLARMGITAEKAEGKAGRGAGGGGEGRWGFRSFVASLKGKGG